MKGVELEDLDELHKLHNDYPLALEKPAIPYDMLSDYYKKVAGKYGIRVDDVKKLIPNLGDKTNYLVHYRNLELNLSLGMKLTNIHKILRFKQSNWMKKYIDFNIEKRENATNSFEKKIFQLMINSVYGKAIANLRRIIGVKIANNEKDFFKHTRKLTFISRIIFGKDYAAIHEIKPVLTLNKPIYVGLTVLELSKWLMYDFHYNFIEKDFDAELQFNDTDSLTYEIKSEDVYDDFHKDKDLFDLSNYPKDAKLFDSANEGVVGKMKDVHKGKPFDKFVGLKSKMHSMPSDYAKESNAAKLVNIATDFKEHGNTLF